MERKTILNLGISFMIILLFFSIIPINTSAWSNGGYSDDPTNPDYGTHDWIAEHALDFLPKNEKQYILDNFNKYLYGTELADNPDGYGDTTKHHVYYWSNGTVQDDAAALRAYDEYITVSERLKEEKHEDAAMFAGSMVHYIADMAVFGNVMGKDTDWGAEMHHSDYEKYVNDRTWSYDSSEFDKYISFDGKLKNISAYQVASDLAYDTTFDRNGDYDCLWMDAAVEVDNHAPVINSISADPKTVEPNGSTTITVDASDEDGDNLTYVYMQSGGTIQGSGATVTWHAPSLDGDYQIRVKVTDGELESAQKNVTVMVRDPEQNRAPAVNSISANPAIVEPDSVSKITVDATDPDGNDLTYFYFKTGGTISGTGASVNWLAPNTEGKYDISVKVSDGALESNIKSVRVTVKAASPPQTDHIIINEFELNPEGTDAGNEWVELYNPQDGDVIIDNWKLKKNDGDVHPISGSIGADGYKIITFPEQWLDNTDERLILLDASSQEVDSTPIKEDNLNDDRSWQRVPNGQDTDSDSDWSQLPDTKGSSNMVRRGTRAYDWEDSAFKDRVGESLNLAINLIADVLHTLAWESGYASEKPNLLPVLMINANEIYGLVPLTVEFRSVASDADGNIESYAWDFGDGETSSDANPTHTFERSGVYAVNLMVTDDDGGTASSSITITVSKKDEEKSEEGPCGLIVLVVLVLPVCGWVGYINKKNGRRR